VTELDTTGGELDWRDAKRAEIIAKAASQLGNQGKGSAQVIGYWRTVMPKSWSDARVREFAKTADWCGGFVLWAYRMSGIALDTDWIMGKGFARPEWLVTKPKPGDFCIRPKSGAGKFIYHHALVESFGDGRLVTIDGNQPGVLRRDRAIPKDNMAYYSIEPFLVEALAGEEAELIREQNEQLGKA
jgi:hypothetical protein